MLTPDSSSSHKDANSNFSGAEAGAAERAARIGELRNDLSAIVAQLKAVVEERAAQASSATIHGIQDGAEIARDTIRHHPVTALAGAALVGAAIAVALTSAQSRKSSSFVDWVPPMSRASIHDMAIGAQRAASSTGASMLSTFERLVDSLSSIDAKSTLTPTLEKASAWFSSLRNAVGK